MIMYASIGLVMMAFGVVIAISEKNS